MKLWFSLLISVLSIALAILPTVLVAQESPPAAFDPAAIDRFVTEQMETQRVPGLALAITRGEEVLYLKGYGSANGQQPITPQTQFLIASLSKSFTAVAVLQLVEAGQIELDAPVQRYLPDFTLADAAAAKTITVRQLLNQVSGLGDTGFPEMRLPAPATLAERITQMQRARLAAAPGTSYIYFNVNYQILARIVEVVSGQPFSTYLHDYLFVPLAMSNTTNIMSSRDLAQTPPDLAQGHLLLFGEPFATGEERGFLGGSGGVVSNAEDMTHFLLMQSNGGRYQGATLLSPQSVDLLHTPPADIISPYAMGWWEGNTANGVHYLEHNGILSTFYSEMVLLPQTGQSFVLLYNIHSLAHDMLGAPAIKDGLIDLLSGNVPSPGRLTVTLWEAIFGVLLLISLFFEVRGLWRLSAWPQQVATQPFWLLSLIILWAFVPAVFVLTMPWLVLRSSGRAFGYITLFRSMLEVMSWLALCGVLGALNGGIRLGSLLRR
ncbi:MAG: serine hydrolase domain-containing protein [Caldilineaceae bacterium]